MNAQTDQSNSPDEPRKPVYGGWEGGHRISPKMGAALLSMVLSHGAPTMAAASLEKAATDSSLTERGASQDRVRGLTPIEIKSVADVTARWHEGHLFTKGNVNMTDAQKADLAGILAREHPNWTVVIMDSARGERYRDFTGGNHRDTIAAHNRLLVELPAQTGYGDLSDPRKPEVKAGAILLIVMDDRRDGLSYRAEELYDRYGLGEENWLKGRNLIELARPGMREGLNTRAAALNTVSRIDAFLNQELERESIQREEQRLQAQNQLNGVQQSFERYTARLNELREKFPSAKGDILYPDKSAIRTDLGVSEESLNRDEYRAVIDRSQRIERLLNERSAELDRFENAPSTFSALGTQIVGARELSSAASRLGEFSEAQRLLKDAQQEWQRGSRAFVATLNAGEKLIGSLPEVVRNYQRAGESLAELESRLKTVQGSKFSNRFSEPLTEAQRKLSDAKKEWEGAAPGYATTLSHAKSLIDEVAGNVRSFQRARSFSTATISALSVAVPSVIGGLLYFRRRSVKAAEAVAREELSKFEKELGEKAQGLFALSAKQNLWLGNSKGEIKARYTGQTQEAALEAYDNVVKSYSYYNQLKKIADAARDCMTNTTLVDKFSGEPYERALAILRAREKIQFNPKVDISLDLSEERGTRVLWARKEDLSAWSLTIDEVRNELGVVAQDADTVLKNLEGVVLEMSSKLGALETELAGFDERIESVKKKSSSTPHLSFEDSYIKMTAAMRSSFVAMKEQSQSDPLKAVDTCRELEEASSCLLDVMERALDVHQSAVPVINSSKRKIEELGFQAVSLNAEIAGLDDRILAELESSPVLTTERRDVILAGFQRIDEVLNQANLAVRLATELADARSRFLPEVENEASQLRDRAAAVLGISSEAVFGGDKENPFAQIKIFKEELGRQISFFEEGREGSIHASSVEIKRLELTGEKVSDLLERGVYCLDNFGKEDKQITAELDVAIEAVETAREVQQKISRTYSESALRLGEGDVSHPHGDNTVSNNIEEADENIHQVAILLEFASESYSSGNLYQALKAHENAKEALIMTGFRLEELYAKQEQLIAADKRNLSAISELEDRGTEIDRELGSPIVTGKTQRRYAQAMKTLESVKLSVAGDRRNPFSEERALGDVGEAFNSTRQLIAVDFDTHREVGKIIGHAEAELSAAKRHLDLMLKDNIPDSRAVVDVSNNLPVLKEELEKLKEGYTAQNLKGDAASYMFDQSGGVEKTVWEVYEERASQLLGKVSSQLSILRNEKVAGEKAFKQVEAARKQVAQVGSWRGSYSVRITGSPGRNELERARTALDRGEYESSTRFALAAVAAASTALNSANREVSRLRQAEAARQARLAAERRAAEQRRIQARRAASSRSSSSGGFGGFSSGGSSGGFGGGFSSGGARGGW